MANIIFSEGSGLNDSVYGKSQEPIRAVIQKSVESFETSPGKFCLYVCIFTFPTLSPVLRRQSPSVLLSTKAKTNRKGVAYMQVTTTDFKLYLFDLIPMVLPHFSSN